MLVDIHDRNNLINSVLLTLVLRVSERKEGRLNLTSCSFLTCLYDPDDIFVSWGKWHVLNIGHKKWRLCSFAVTTQIKCSSLPDSTMPHVPFRVMVVSRAYMWRWGVSSRVSHYRKIIVNTEISTFSGHSGRLARRHKHTHCCCWHNWPLLIGLWSLNSWTLHNILSVLQPHTGLSWGRWLQQIVQKRETLTWRLRHSGEYGSVS